MKFKVLKKCTLTIEKDSIVIIEDPNQIELAKGLLSKVKEEKKKKEKGE